MDIDRITEKITELRHKLHSCPEISGEEYKTKDTLKNWLKENTSLQLADLDGGFYAIHRETIADSTIMLRADYDALATPDGGACHLCGHDGHAAGLCGLALFLEGRSLGKNIILLFQSGEETGVGAEKCCDIFDKEHIDEVYGLHNLPGFEFGRVFTKKGTFACASRGISLKLEGKPTHAAYPENGISPARAVGKILCELDNISNPEFYSAMTMCTVIGTEMGEKAFGAAAEKAEIWLTLRGEHDSDIMLLQQKISDFAAVCAEADKLKLSIELHDIFPATENEPSCAEKVLNICQGQVLEAPMRWSEDFGHYLRLGKGAFFGIGAGTDCPPLHTEFYEYPDSLLEKSVEAFIKLIQA